MSSLLTEKEIADSFLAVKQFLQDKDNISGGGNISCWFIQGFQKSRVDIRVEYIAHIPAYYLDYYVFKSYGLVNPIWTSYKLLKWDEKERELIIEVDQLRKIKLKRI